MLVEREVASQTPNQTDFSFTHQGQEPPRAPVCEAGIGQDRQGMWVPSNGHTEGLLQAVSDKCLVVSRW